MIALRFSSPALITDTQHELGKQELGKQELSNQHTGVITRICNFKYGFIKSEGHQNIFFHFSELSDDCKATVEPGCTVTFHVKENQWTNDKKLKAIRIEVVSAPLENAFKNLEGVVQGDMKSRGFCFIEHDSTTYLFHSANLVEDEASKAAGGTVKAGMKVTFNAEWNHKYNPPKPFATCVRIIPDQDTLPPAVDADTDTWMRGSRLALGDEAGSEAGHERDSISPSGGPGRSSISERASALKMNKPVRRWSRTTDLNTGEKSAPAGGLRLTVTTCKYGRKCNRDDCWFEHPKGREMEDGLKLVSDDQPLSPEEMKVTSMGKASLRMLVKALVGETGHTNYIAIRNALQKPEHFGRALTREEKNSLGDILEQLDRTNRNNKTLTATPDNRSSYCGTRSSGRGHSLADLCRDPSLHSRLSAANNMSVCP